MRLKVATLSQSLGTIVDALIMIVEELDTVTEELAIFFANPIHKVKVNLFVSIFVISDLDLYTTYICSTGVSILVGGCRIRES
jgi:hypothetical protein